MQGIGIKMRKRSAEEPICIYTAIAANCCGGVPLCCTESVRCADGFTALYRKSDVLSELPVQAAGTMLVENAVIFTEQDGKTMDISGFR